METLKTFIHLSDLHIDDQPFVFPEPPPPWYSPQRYFEGYLGHSSGSLTRLFYFWQANLGSNPQLIVTGDVTRVGRASQFDFANDYLGSVLMPPIADELGLRQASWVQWAIPGNHDHWPGFSTIVGPPTRGLEKYFSHIPASTPPIDLGRGRTLRFFWINSDADIAWEGKSRLGAIGAFASELRKLDKLLQSAKPDGNEIRVLALHHSREMKKRIRGIKRTSREALEDFIIRNDIAVLLTGHVHSPILDSFPLATRTGEVLEARCGTTTQSTNPPALRERANRWANSLLVHKVEEISTGELYWKTEVFVEDRAANVITGGEGFMKALVLPEGRRPEYSMKVWPRP